MNIVPGQYINNGLVDLMVVDVRDYEGKKYVQVFDEKNEVAYFCEIVRLDDGYKFERVISDSLSKQLLIYFSDVESIIKGEKSIDEI